MQNLERPEKAKQHILFDNILLLQITPILGKAAPGMQCACFVTKTSVDAAPLEQIAYFFYENSIMSLIFRAFQDRREHEIS